MEGRCKTFEPRARPQVQQAHPSVQQRHNLHEVTNLTRHSSVNVCVVSCLLVVEDLLLVRCAVILSRCVKLRHLKIIKSNLN